MKVSIDDFVGERGVSHVDFIKTDTDGHDLEALVSCESTISNGGVLGLMVEAPLIGGLHDTSESFHAMDLFLQKKGFLPFSLSFYKYSRIDLPGVFLMDDPAQTQTGQAKWGDVVYLRDMASPYYSDIWPEPTLIQAMKMLCLMEMFGLNDCATELLLKRRDLFDPVFSVNEVLDMLPPRLQRETPEL